MGITAFAPADPEVQWLRARSRRPLYRHGSGAKFLMPIIDANRALRWIAKPLVFLLGLLPVAWLFAGLADWPAASLGANPVEKIQDTLGIWGLRFLLVTLAVTPLRDWTGWIRLLAFRRMLGLF